MAAPQSWPPHFCQTTPATLYMGLVYLDRLNKCNLPSDKLLKFYWTHVFPRHFEGIDPDLKNPNNFDVSVSDIKGEWPQLIKFHVINKTEVPGQFAPKNVQYLLYVEYGTDVIHVKKANFVRSYIVQKFQPPPDDGAAPVDGVAALSMAPVPARQPAQMGTESASVSAARAEAENLLALSYAGNDGPREES